MLVSTSRLIAELPLALRDVLASITMRAQFARGQFIHLPWQEDASIHFVEKGIAAITCGAHEDVTDVALIGSEGLLGGTDGLIAIRSPFASIARTDLLTLSIKAPQFHDLLASSPELRGLVMRYSGSLMEQVAGTAHANARFTVEERLARWLWMAMDRLNSRQLSFTHAELASAIGCRRAGVTVAMHDLEGRKILRQNHRNRFDLVDPDGLRSLARLQHPDDGSQDWRQRDRLASFDAAIAPNYARDADDQDW